MMSFPLYTTGLSVTIHDGIITLRNGNKDISLTWHDAIKLVQILNVSRHA